MKSRQSNVGENRSTYMHLVCCFYKLLFCETDSKIFEIFWLWKNCFAGSYNWRWNLFQFDWKSRTEQGFTDGPVRGPNRSAFSVKIFGQHFWFTDQGFSPWNPLKRVHSNTKMHFNLIIMAVLFFHKEWLITIFWQYIVMLMCKCWMTNHLLLHWATESICNRIRALSRSMGLWWLESTELCVWRIKKSREKSLKGHHDCNVSRYLSLYSDQLCLPVRW